MQENKYIPKELIDKFKFKFDKDNIIIIFNASDKELMNPISPNHIGLEIGRVIEINKDRITSNIKLQFLSYSRLRFLEKNTKFALHVSNFIY